MATSTLIETASSAPVAKRGDRVRATDIHLVVPASGGPAVPLSLPFTGALEGSLSTDVFIEDRPAAIVGSTANNQPAHVPGTGAFVSVPSNRGTVTAGSPTVRINDKPAARDGDQVTTCNDPTDAPVGTVSASGTVLCG